MIRTTPQRRYHVSNRAALIAALVLALTSFAGVYSSGSYDAQIEQQTVAAISQSDNDRSDSTVRKRKLSLSLLLFGRG
jgi:hypothetical protein